MIKKLLVIGHWSLVIVISLVIGHWSLDIASAAPTPKPTPFPTSPYTCIQNKSTCMTENACFKKIGGTCPRGEVCCDIVAPPSPSPTPYITPYQAPGVRTGFVRWTVCQFEQYGREYHPLRPYAASPCASHLIPNKYPEAPLNKPFPKLWQTFSCGTNAEPAGQVKAPGVVVIDNVLKRYPYTGSEVLFFHLVNTTTKKVMCPPGDPTKDATLVACDAFKQAYEGEARQSYPVLCDRGTGMVCFIGKVVFNITLDYSDILFPILGNTKDLHISDRTKLNNYLSWYLNGAILHAENKDLNLAKETDEDRVINFSGPVLKLLSQESLNRYRQGLVELITLYSDDVHWYSVGGGKMNGTSQGGLAEFATEEDIVSETQPGIIKTDQPKEPEIDGRIVYIELLDIQGDSRLYFPHLKNSVAMSTYLMSTYKPVTEKQMSQNPLDAAKSIRQLVGQRFTFSQGLRDITLPSGAYKVVDWGDDTDVQYDWFPFRIPPAPNFEVRNVSRNTEVKVGYPAPTPLFTNYSDRFPSVSSQKCVMQPAKGGPGDSLIGGKLSGELTMWQIFRYKPKGLVIDPAGVPLRNYCSEIGLGPFTSPQCKVFGPITPPDGCSSMESAICNGTGDTSSCCYGTCADISPCDRAGYICGGSSAPCANGFTLTNLSCSSSTNPSNQVCWGCPLVTPKPRPPKCSFWPDHMVNTKGRIAIYVKVPFVEKLYDILIARKDSLLRRFLPLGGPGFDVNTAVFPTPGPEPAITPVPTSPISTNCCVGPTFCESLNSNEASCRSYASQGCSWTCISPTPTPGPPTPTPIVPPDFLKNAKEAIPGEGTGGKYYANPDETAGANIYNPEVVAGGNLYYPRIGSLFEYLLGAGKDPLNLQCILRPKGYCNVKPQVCLGAICDVAEKYNIDCDLLKAIYAIETCNGTLIGTGGGSGCCNGNGYCGPMQVGEGSRYEGFAAGDDLKLCMTECKGMDNFELAARGLLTYKWCYMNYDTCVGSPDPFAYKESYIADYGDPHVSNREDVVAFIERWYGVSVPDADSERRWGTGVSYVDAVLHLMKINDPDIPSTADFSGIDACFAKPPLTSDPTTGEACNTSCSPATTGTAP